MPTVTPGQTEAFAVWLTGLPASGKSTIARALGARLEALGLRAAILESDSLRRIFSSAASYDQEDRERFYRQVAFVADLLVRHGVPVIIAATANRRSYRDLARHMIPRFFEVYVDTPLAVCMERDPKGIYRNAREGRNRNVPGLQVPYEPPDHPEVIAHGGQETAEQAAGRIVDHLKRAGALAG